MWAYTCWRKTLSLNVLAGEYDICRGGVALLCLLLYENPGIAHLYLCT